MQSAIATPRDPLRNFQFTIRMAGAPAPVGGVQKVGGLNATVSATEVWEGGNNLHRYANPERVTWDPITLEQGIALDNTLELWAIDVQKFLMTGSASGPVKRNVTIELWAPSNMAGAPIRAQQTPARRYNVVNAWISRYNAVPRLDALASEAALLSVELIHEGWTVDLNPESNAGPSPALS